MADRQPASGQGVGHRADRGTDDRARAAVGARAGANGAGRAAAGRRNGRAGRHRGPGLAVASDGTGAAEVSLSHPLYGEAIRAAPSLRANRSNIGQAPAGLLARRR